jgi:hypothetical protein
MVPISNRRLAVSIAMVLATGGLSGSPVAAAVPANDDIDSPREVGPLPYRDGPYVTSGATPGDSDPESCGGSGPSVWYAFTPQASGRLVAHTMDSTYDTVLYVGTRAAWGGIDVIACDDDWLGRTSALMWNAQAGTEYLLMVGAFANTKGRTLQLSVDRVVGSATVGIRARAQLGDTRRTKLGRLTVRGSIRCSSGLNGGAYIRVNARQAQRDGTVRRAVGYAWFDECREDRQPWVANVRPRSGGFRAGDVDVTARVRVYCPFYLGNGPCATGRETRTVLASVPAPR